MESLIAPFDAYKGNEPYIFVSYAHKNSGTVFSHITRLRERGYRIWYDEGIDPGTDWSDEIAAALNGATSFLVFISPESVASHNVKKEIVFALSKKKHMICVHIAETELPLGLEMQLGNIQAILEDRFHDKNKFYERLFASLPDTTGEQDKDKDPIESNKTAPVNTEIKSNHYEESPAPAPSVQPVSAGVENADNFEMLNFGVLKKYTGNNREVTIPWKYFRILSMAFDRCDTLEKVIIPEHVTELDLAAFDRCNNLTSVTIEGKQVKIGIPNFGSCPKLTITCHRDSFTHEQLKKSFSGSIEFWVDA